MAVLVKRPTFGLHQCWKHRCGAGLEIADGNMTSDGTNSYSWDAENRLIKITYPGSGNNSQFTYDGFGRNVEIVETVSGSVTSTKQMVWASDKDATESAV